MSIDPTVANDWNTTTRQLAANDILRGYSPRTMVVPAITQIWSCTTGAAILPSKKGEAIAVCIREG